MAQCLKMISITHDGVSHRVPCGKCPFCLQNKRSQWMFRVHHEMRTQDLPGYFVTLTYADHMVPFVSMEDKRLTLRFRHVQLFIKKLRKHKHKCKYIAVGEYGGETARPHYHLILWTSCPSHKFESFWSNADGKTRGRCHIGTLTMSSAMYTLKYIIQPKHKPSDDDPREKTRAQFSKGLGLAYLTTKVYNWHTEDYDEPKTWSYIEGAKLALPRYYRTKIFTRYQMAVEGRNQYLKAAKEKRSLIKEYVRKGIKKPDRYYDQMRVEQANAILRTTKGLSKI